MIITIEMDNDQYLEVLRKWASVSRTLDTAENACEVAAEHGESEGDREKFGWCLTELRTIHRPIDALHHAVRSQIWHHDVALKGDKQHKIKRVKISSITVDRNVQLCVLEQKMIDAIAESFQQIGHKNPLLVRPHADGHGFKLVDGLVRLEAAKKLGWGEIDVLVPSFPETPGESMKANMTTHRIG